MRFFRQDLHLLAGAYALDALEPGNELDPLHPPPGPLPVLRQRGPRVP